jgi:hypothetical protein
VAQSPLCVANGCGQVIDLQGLHDCLRVLVCAELKPSHG